MIVLDNVTFEYEDAPRPAMQEVSLTINKGEFLAVVGHNGSGKSTLAKHLNALLLPTAGRVLVEDMDTREEENMLPIRQKVGMVFQNPDNQLVTTIVEEDVAFGPENLGISPEEIRSRVDAALNKVGMSKYADRAPHMLSGGQKQRIAIAGMLAMQPQVLVMDEATAMLDPEGRRDVLDILKKLNRENGITVVMITQFMEEAVDCDRIAVMDHGKLCMLGTPREVFAQAELLRAIGLDIPAAVKLQNDLGLCLENVPLTMAALAETLAPLLNAGVKKAKV